MLGSALTRDLFGKSQFALGLTVRGELFGEKFSARVAGVAKPYGTSILADVDSSAIMPLDSAESVVRRVTGSRRYGAGRS